jgi:hypothetical protein
VYVALLFCFRRPKKETNPTKFLRTQPRLTWAQTLPTPEK